jgi:hypothetical protein
MVHFEIMETTGLFIAGFQQCGKRECRYMYISTNISRMEMFIRITIMDQDAVIGKTGKAEDRRQRRLKRLPGITRLSELP